METGTKKHLYILIAGQVIICILASILISILIENISNSMQKTLEQEALNITEHKMRERVENMISNMEHERESVLDSISTQGDFIIRMAAQTLHQERGSLHDWVRFLATMKNGKALHLMLYHSQRQEKTEFIISENKVEEIINHTPINQWQSFVMNCPYHLIAPYGEYSLYIVTTKESIDKISQGFIYELIHTSVYGTDGYVWVNEVVNFEGGENYAIRRIHPTMPEMEGSFLSTSDTDMDGAQPYLTELKGIKEQGEIFHTYHFSKENDDIVGRKASYAKLYEPFNWIIATGEHLSLVFSNVHGNTSYLQLHNKNLLRSTLFAIIFLLILFFTVDICLIVASSRKHNTQINAFVEKETRHDLLTGAYNRKSGEEILSELFLNYQHGGDAPLIMMLDLDNFKNVNDTYGHDMGDEVLQRASQAILSNIRAEDKLFRWGGEEFVLLFGYTSTDHDTILGNKILQKINHLQFTSGSKTFSISVSIGSSRFHGGDTNWRQVLKRADMALYHSKGSGKNCHTNYDTEMLSSNHHTLEDIFHKQTQEEADVSQYYHED